MVIIIIIFLHSHHSRNNQSLLTMFMIGANQGLMWLCVQDVAAVLHMTCAAAVIPFQIEPY